MKAQGCSSVSREDGSFSNTHPVLGGVPWVLHCLGKTQGRLLSRQLKPVSFSGGPWNLSNALTGSMHFQGKWVWIQESLVASEWLISCTAAQIRDHQLRRLTNVCWALEYAHACLSHLILKTTQWGQRRHGAQVAGGNWGPGAKFWTESHLAPLPNSESLRLQKQNLHNLIGEAQGGGALIPSFFWPSPWITVATLEKQQLEVQDA